MKFKKKDVIILVLIAVFVFVIIKISKDKKVQKEQVDSKANAQDGSTPEHQPYSVEYNNKAKDVKETFDNHYLFWSPDMATSTLNMLNKLNDADLIEVSNAFSQLYTSSSYTYSMKGLLQAEYFGWGDVDKLRDKVVDRLAKLGA